MEDILPQPILDTLREHYYAGVTAAEIGFEHNAADEDSVTGALGQALLTRGIRIVEIGDTRFGWRVTHYKIGGRGKGAPEKKLGADGVFQLEVFNEEGQVLRRKALLFQAKKRWRGTDRSLFGQARQMSEYAESAIVIDYEPSGFKAVSGIDVIEARGSRRALRPGSEIRLAEVLGDDFVRCRRGEIGVYWNPETHTLARDTGVLMPGLIPSHIITTTVRAIPRSRR